MKKIMPFVLIGILVLSGFGAVAFQANNPSSHQFNYVIITTHDLENAVISLKNCKEYLGFSVEIVNTSWISINYTGKDMQEQIRNFLIDKY